MGIAGAFPPDEQWRCSALTVGADFHCQATNSGQGNHAIRALGCAGHVWLPGAIVACPADELRNGLRVSAVIVADEVVEPSVVEDRRDNSVEVARRAAQRCTGREQERITRNDAVDAY